MKKLLSTIFVLLGIAVSAQMVLATIRTPVPVDSNTPTKYLLELPTNVTGTLTVSGDVSINSSIDNGLLSAVNASNTTVLKVSTTTNATSSAVTLNVLGNASTSPKAPVNVFQIMNDGHLNATGTLPVLSACGSSPTIAGSDSGGIITVGTGVVTSCTMTFQVPFESSNNFCTISDNSTAITGDISALSSSSVTFSFSASLGGGKIFYFCGFNL